MKRVTFTPLARILAADAKLASWNARREREAALLAVVRRALPRAVAERVFVNDAQRSDLELSTPSGAIASVVRQKGPDILARLRAEGWEFSGISLRVQPRPSPPELPKALPRQWDSANRRPLAALEAGLAEGPLKNALRRFLRSR